MRTSKNSSDLDRAAAARSIAVEFAEVRVVVHHSYVAAFVARSDRGGEVGQLATTDEFIIKQASYTSIMTIASEKTAWFKPTFKL